MDHFFVKAGLVGLLSLSLLVGCSSEKSQEQSVTEDQASVSSEQAESKEASKSLEGHTLHIFCGAGMKKPFGEIAQAFEEATGCKMEVSYANAAQIQTQINTAQEGDFFIAGSGVEVEPVQSFVADSTPLVKHIPVIAVAKGNPKGITGPADLANEDVRLLIGDPSATPIGKIANKVFKDFSIGDKVNIVSNTATAPAMSQALAADECDAVIIWKENVDPESAEIVESPEMEAYIKNIPAVQLNCSKDADASAAFLDFLTGTEAQNIWIAHGYVLA